MAIEPQEILRMTRERPEDVAAVLHELAGLLTEGQSIQAMLQRLVELANRRVGGCHAAGITFDGGSRPYTTTYSDARTLEVDQAQYDAGEGPCLEAIRTGQLHSVDVEESEARWPEFTAAARLAAIRSFLAAPLVVLDKPVGALNLYSHDQNGFEPLDEAFVALLSEQAAAVLSIVERYGAARDLAGQFEEAMHSRAPIEQAKGVLMARHGVDADAAFDLLRRQSQERNIRLHQVALQVLDSTRPG
jgi:GAF domain-containing protein